MRANTPGEAALDRTVAQLNIDHYRRLLATETEEARRHVLLELLAKEESKLAEAGKPEPTAHKPLAR